MKVQVRASGIGTSVALLAPVVAVLVIALAIPSIWAVVLSLTDAKLGHPSTFVGLENFRRLFFETRGFWASAIRTVAFTVSVVVLEISVGLAFSLLLARGFALQRLWVALLIAPLAVSPVVAIIVWRYMLAPNYGMINYLIESLGARAPNWFVKPAAALGAIALIDVWLNSPFVLAILYPSIVSIAPELIEAAEIDGASYSQRLRFVTLPLIRPAILTTTVFRLIFTLRIFSPVWLFAQGGPAGATKVLSIFLYEQAFVYHQFGMGSSVALVLLVVTLVLSRRQMVAMRRMLFQ